MKFVVGKKYYLIKKPENTLICTSLVDDWFLYLQDLKGNNMVAYQEELGIHYLPVVDFEKELEKI
jgi:hypothetical protein